MKQTIGEYASSPVVGVASDARVMEALRLMSERRISCIIVLSDDEPVGILTERDVVFAANWLLGQPDLLIREVMNKPVMTATEDMSIAQAYQVFSQHKIRHLVVLDAQLDMVGIFTQTDLVRSLREKAFDGINDVIGLMSSKVLRVTPDVPARYALSLMARRSVSCVVVVDDSQPVGMFTERDVVRCVAEGIDLENVAVETVMSPTVVSMPMSTAPQETIGLMSEKSIRRMLVTDEYGDIAGILTQTDVGRVLDRKNLGDISQLLS